MKNRALALQIGLAIVPIIISLLVTTFLVLAAGASPGAVLQNLWEGAFRNTTSLAQVLNFWIPLTLASIGLVVTFTAGLWNIGVEGQITMGAVFASWAAFSLPLPPILLIPAELIVAMIGGMLWGALVGFLKVRLGVNEIFGGVALNALANTFSIYLITGPWQPPEGGSVQSTPPFPADAILPRLADTLPINLLMLVLAVIAVIVVVIALRGSRWGLQLKATGKNARSALLLGVPTNRTAMSAFLVCGALAGLAGSYRVLFTFGSLRPQVSSGIGFLGVLIVLLLSSRPLWVPFVAFVFAAILTGSGRLKTTVGLDSSLAGVLQGSLVLIVLLFNGVRGRLVERGWLAGANEAPPNVQPTATERPAHE
jgi:general nucleoside transport system permease protein